MVSCQEPPPLKGSKHSLQCHPHDAALVNAHSFVSMRAEARCCPCHSAAHCQHMKKQPSLCHCCPCHDRCHCNCGHHLHLHCHCRLCQGRCCRCRRPLLLPLPLAIAIAVTVNHCCRHLCCVAVSHCHCRRPCHRPLPSLSPSAIAVAISIGHHHLRCHQPFWRVVALVRQELYSNN